MTKSLTVAGTFYKISTNNAVQLALTVVLVADDEDVRYSDRWTLYAVGDRSWADIHADNARPEHVHVAAVHRPLHCVRL